MGASPVADRFGYSGQIGRLIRRTRSKVSTLSIQDIALYNGKPIESTYKREEAETSRKPFLNQPHTKSYSNVESNLKITEGLNVISHQENVYNNDDVKRRPTRLNRRVLYDNNYSGNSEKADNGRDEYSSDSDSDDSDSDKSDNSDDDYVVSISSKHSLELQNDSLSQETSSSMDLGFPSYNISNQNIDKDVMEHFGSGMQVDNIVILDKKRLVKLVRQNKVFLNRTKDFYSHNRFSQNNNTKPLHSNHISKFQYSNDSPETIDKKDGSLISSYSSSLSDQTTYTHSTNVHSTTSSSTIDSLSSDDDDSIYTLKNKITNKRFVKADVCSEESATFDEKPYIPAKRKRELLKFNIANGFNLESDSSSDVDSTDLNDSESNYNYKKKKFLTVGDIPAMELGSTSNISDISTEKLLHRRSQEAQSFFKIFENYSFSETKSEESTHFDDDMTLLEKYKSPKCEPDTSFGSVFNLSPPTMRRFRSMVKYSGRRKIVGMKKSASAGTSIPFINVEQANSNSFDFLHINDIDASRFSISHNCLLESATKRIIYSTVSTPKLPRLADNSSRKLNEIKDLLILNARTIWSDQSIDIHLIRSSIDESAEPENIAFILSQATRKKERPVDLSIRTCTYSNCGYTVVPELKKYNPIFSIECINEEKLNKFLIQKRKRSNRNQAEDLSKLWEKVLKTSVVKNKNQKLSTVPTLRQLCSFSLGNSLHNSNDQKIFGTEIDLTLEAQYYDFVPENCRRSLLWSQIVNIISKTKNFHKVSPYVIQFLYNLGSSVQVWSLMKQWFIRKSFNRTDWDFVWCINMSFTICKPVSMFRFICANMTPNFITSKVFENHFLSSNRYYHRLALDIVQQIPRHEEYMDGKVYKGMVDRISSMETTVVINVMRVFSILLIDRLPDIFSDQLNHNLPPLNNKIRDITSIFELFDIRNKAKSLKQCIYNKIESEKVLSLKVGENDILIPKDTLKSILLKYKFNEIRFRLRNLKGKSSSSFYADRLSPKICSRYLHLIDNKATFQKIPYIIYMLDFIYTCTIREEVFKTWMSNEENGVGCVENRRMLYDSTEYIIQYVTNKDARKSFFANNNTSYSRSIFSVLEHIYKKNAMKNLILASIARDIHTIFPKTSVPDNDGSTDLKNGNFDYLECFDFECDSDIVDYDKLGTFVETDWIPDWVYKDIIFTNSSCSQISSKKNIYDSDEIEKTEDFVASKNPAFISKIYSKSDFSGVTENKSGRKSVHNISAKEPFLIGLRKLLLYLNDYNALNSQGSNVLIRIQIYEVLFIISLNTNKLKQIIPRTMHIVLLMKSLLYAFGESLISKRLDAFSKSVLTFLSKRLYELFIEEENSNSNRIITFAKLSVFGITEKEVIALDSVYSSKEFGHLKCWGVGADYTELEFKTRLKFILMNSLVVKYEDNKDYDLNDFTNIVRDRQKLKRNLREIKRDTYKLLSIMEKSRKGYMNNTVKRYYFNNCTLQWNCSVKPPITVVVEKEIFSRKRYNKSNYNSNSVVIVSNN